MHLPIPSPRFLLPVLVLLLAGCASVEKRIDANAALFSGYPPETQSLIRQGKIALGFDEKMVEIAKGPPNYVNLRQSPDGETTVWRYMQLRQYSRAVPVYNTGRRGSNWVDVTETDEVEVLRVEFRNGEVIGFEELQ